MAEQPENAPISSQVTRRQALKIGLGAAVGTVVGATGLSQVKPDLLESAGRFLLHESFSLNEHEDRLTVTVADAIGFRKALVELTKRRAGDMRPFELRCHKGTYIFEDIYDIALPPVHPQKDKPDENFHSSAAIILPENTGIIAVDKGVEFELPPAEIGIVQQITSDTATVTFDGISFSSKGKVGNEGLSDGGVKAMLLITGSESATESRSVVIRNCSFNEQTHGDVYEPFKDYQTDFRSGIIVNNVQNLELDSVRVQDPRWDGILGVNIANMTAGDCIIERNQDNRAKVVGSALAIINRRKTRAQFSINNSTVRNFRKCMGFFEGHSDVKVDAVRCDQDEAFDIENRPGWVFGGDDFNLDAKNVKTSGPMFGSFLTKAKDTVGTYRFTDCVFETNNDPHRDEERGYPFNIYQEIDGERNSSVIGINSAIHFTHQFGNDKKILAKLAHLPGFVYEVHDDILLKKGMGSESRSE